VLVEGLVAVEDAVGPEEGAELGVPGEALGEMEGDAVPGWRVALTAARRRPRVGS
jgi:hypothetical protein